MSRKLHPIKTRTFRKFLKKQNCKFVRIKGDHEIWRKQNLIRDIVFVTNEKEVPPFHIKTNLKTLNISVEEFLKIINEI